MFQRSREEHMPNTSKFTCFLMGSQSRLIQCAEVLLKKDHVVNGIISAEPSIQRWVKENKLRLIHPSDDLVKILKNTNVLPASQSRTYTI